MLLEAAKPAVEEGLGLEVTAADGAAGLALVGCIKLGNLLALVAAADLGASGFR